MSTQGAISRYMIVLEILRNKRFPTFDDLKRNLDQKGFDVSHRTLQRIIDELRNEFKVEIGYDRKKNGYYVDYENSPGYNKLLKLANLNEKSLLLQSAFNKRDVYLNSISFEFEGDFPNIELLPKLLESIASREEIEILHFRFDIKQKYWIRVSPYLLKEYNNRFYLIGKNTKGIVKSYGIDRIADVRFTGSKYKEDKTFTPQLFYSNVIGVYFDYAAKVCEKVILSFNPLAAQYLKSVPWHSSQQVHEKENEVLVELYVHVNYELVQKILAQGTWVKVLEPQSLVDRLKNELTKTLLQYR